MKAATPLTNSVVRRNQSLFHIDFACYSLSHYSFPRHFHDHYVIELVVKGADRFYCNGKNYTAAGNQLVLINPGEVHTGSTVSDTPLVYYSFYPYPSMLREVAEWLEIPFTGTWNFPEVIRHPASLAEKMQRMFESVFADEDPLLVQQQFAGCMLELFDSRTSHPGQFHETAKDTRIRCLLEYIHQHFREPITLEQMTELVHLNVFHLIRLFRKMTGLSPYEYVLNLRTCYATQLLRKGHQVRQAAALAGFYDTSHLNRYFKKLTGMTPRSLRLSKSQYPTSLPRV